MSEADAGGVTERALEESGVADMRPAYRKLLVRLKQARPVDFEEATRRYREELEPSIAAGDLDPVAAWLSYGRWLAEQVVAGNAVAIDRTGRSHPLDRDAEPERDSLVLHMPDDERAPALLLSIPRAPSEAQRMAAELLVR